MIAQPLNSRLGRLAALLTVPVLAIGTLTTAADEEGKKPTREGDGDGARKTGPRDGEARKEGARDGDVKRTGPRDGEGARKVGARDGEGMKRGEGDGEGRKSAEREDGARKSAESEGGEKRREGGERAPVKASTATVAGQQLIIAVNTDGNVVNSQGEVIDIKMVRGRMKDIAENNPGQSVILRAATDTPHAKILNVLDALKDVGLKDVTMEQAQ